MAIENYRIDPFTGADNSVLIENESVTVPASSPYYVELAEIPKKYTVSLGFGGANAPEILDRLDIEDCRYVLSEAPTTNTGEVTGTSVGDTDTISIHPVWTYMEFDHNDIPAGFNECSLWLWHQDVGNGYPTQRTLAIGWNLAAWDPATITWNNRPAYNASYATTFNITSTGWYEIDVTAMIDNMKTGGGTNNGFLIRDLSDQLKGDVHRQFDSPTGVNPPYLIWTEGGSADLVEVTPASANQFEVNQARGKLHLHSSRAGQTVKVTYRGLGTLVSKTQLEAELT